MKRKDEKKKKAVKEKNEMPVMDKKMKKGCK